MQTTQLQTSPRERSIFRNPEITKTEKSKHHIISFIMWNLINRNKLRYRGQTDGCQMRGAGRMGDEGQGLRSTTWQLQNSRGDVKYSTRNTVSNVVILHSYAWCQVGN